jgi:hypothetical protein
MRIENKFNIGEHVYVITDKEQQVGIINGIMLTKNDILYFVGRDNNTDRFYDYELSLDKNQLITL